MFTQCATLRTRWTHQYERAKLNRLHGTCTCPKYVNYHQYPRFRFCFLPSFEESACQGPAASWCQASVPLPRLLPLGTRRSAAPTQLATCVKRMPKSTTGYFSIKMLNSTSIKLKLSPHHTCQNARNTRIYLPGLTNTSNIHWSQS